MPLADLSNAIWRKSSYSGNGGEACVELANVTGMTAVRDSKNPTGPVLIFPTTGLRGFLTSVKVDRLDG